MLNFSLRLQLTILISVLITVAVSVTGYLNMSREEKALKGEYRLRGIAIAEALAEQCKAGLIVDDKLALYRHLTAIAAKEDVSFGLVLDTQGRVVMHNSLRELSATLPERFSQALLVSGATLCKEYEGEHGRPVHDVIVPITAAGTRLGTLVMGYTHDGIGDRIEKAKKQLLLIGLVAIIAGIVLANIIAFYFSTPLRKLIDATGKIVGGDYNVHVPDNRKDELGMLAASFNRMAEYLKTAVVSQQYLDNIFNSAGDAIRVVGMDLSVVKCNRSFEEMTGLSGEEVVGSSCSKLLGGSFCRDGACLLQRVREGEQHVSSESTAFLHDGRKINVIVSATPLIENGKLIGVIESIHDISDRVQAEEQREKLHLQFLQAQKMESVGRLAGGVAHDFNNILSVILGYGDLLLQELPGDHPAAGRVAFIKNAALKASTLTRQLLALSRKQILATEVINLNGLVENMLKMVSRLIGEDISLAFIPGKGLKNIKADPMQMEQIFMNLAVNARDAMPGGGRLTIETINVEGGEEILGDGGEDLRAGAFVRIVVTDTGMGMDETVQKNIFEPFFTTKDRDKGTGLGLSTVYAIVKQHNGHITLKSEVNKGTSFTLSFPVVEEEETGILSQAPEEIRHGTEQILVVDDEQIVRQLLKDVLSSYGYRILSAESGEEAIRVSDEFPGDIDLLVTDITMTGITGWELAERLTASRSGLKVIFMSGYIDNIELRQEMMRAHDIFIQKPLLSNDLLGKVREILGPEKDETHPS